MSFRTLRDETREAIIADEELAPTREVQYVHKDGITETINSFVGNGQFNKQEKESSVMMENFGGLKLSSKPKVGDKVIYDGYTFKVVRHTRPGTLYTVYCEISQSNKRPSGKGGRRP